MDKHCVIIELDCGRVLTSEVFYNDEPRPNGFICLSPELSIDKCKDFIYRACVSNAVTVDGIHYHPIHTVRTFIIQPVI